MDWKGRTLVLMLVVVALVAGFFVSFFLGWLRSDSQNDAGRTLTVGSKDELIIVGRFPSGWPPDFPLPTFSRPKWAVTKEPNLWICFTYEPASDGPLGDRLVRFFRQRLRLAGYLLGPTEQEEESPGSFSQTFGFLYPDVDPDYEGKITVPLDSAAIRLGGIPCDYSVEVTHFR